jgi:hypothetical protein
MKISKIRARRIIELVKGLRNAKDATTSAFAAREELSTLIKPKWYEVELTKAERRGKTFEEQQELRRQKFEDAR